MTTFQDPTPCRVCGSVRKPHKPPKNSTKHKYVEPLETNPNYIAKCGCGNVCDRGLIGRSDDWMELRNVLIKDGWRQVGDTWKCPDCKNKSRK